MGLAGAAFNAKHPRGFHGKFGSGGRSYSVQNIGRKGMSRIERQDAAAAGKRIFAGHNLASAQTLAYASKKSGRKRAIVKFGPALYTDTKTGKHTEVIGRSRFSAKSFMYKPAGYRPKRKG